MAGQAESGRKTGLCSPDGRRPGSKIEILAQMKSESAIPEKHRVNAPSTFGTRLYALLYSPFGAVIIGSCVATVGLYVSAPSTFGTTLYAFLNSPFGALIIGSCVATLGLFTWQRKDWLFKEQYYRTQVMIDRRIGLIERVNSDVGQLLAHGDNVIAAFYKNALVDQKNSEIERYNKQQAQWFATSSSYQALLGFYFARTDVPAKFTRIVEATQELDVQIYDMGKGDLLPEIVHEGSMKVRHNLQIWNDLALRDLFSTEK